MDIASPYPNMLSIIIPTYNFNCAHLICELQKQCEELAATDSGFEYEIIVGDDHSTDAESITCNAVIEALPHCTYIIYDENVGRTGNRNRLLDECKKKWVLMADADAEVITSDFIQHYWSATQSYPDADIFVGGLLTPPVGPPGCELRHRYELQADKSRTLSFRRAHPADQFTTFNVMVRRSVLDTLHFDPRCSEYGYEDALFGIEAERMGWRIMHIDNPLLHTGINPSVQFLKNTEAALRMLYKLGSPMTERARVAVTAERFRRMGCAPVFRWLFRITAPIMKVNLFSRHPNLKVFAFYKLGYYLSLH